MATSDIRRLSARDAQLLRTTRLGALADSPEAFGTTLAEAQGRSGEWWQRQASGRLGDRPCATWIAMDADGRGVGMLTGVEQAEAVDVIQVWVAADRRGSGLVDELFGELFAWAPHPRIDMAVAKSNARARSAYERLGFQVIGERPGTPETEVEMTQERRRNPS
jgi:ribosomal protein S18 acetylase RimI-like enzyme